MLFAVAFAEGDGGNEVIPRSPYRRFAVFGGHGVEPKHQNCQANRLLDQDAIVEACADLTWINVGSD